MAKIGYHTYDIFDNESIKTRMKYFDFCHNKALKAGLTCKCMIKNGVPILEMWGTKWQFLRYYLRTLLKCGYKIGGIKHFVSFFFK